APGRRPRRPARQPHVPAEQLPRRPAVHRAVEPGRQPNRLAEHPGTQGAGAAFRGWHRQQQRVGRRPRAHGQPGAEALLRHEERRLGASAEADPRRDRQPGLCRDHGLGPRRRPQGSAVPAAGPRSPGSDEVSTTSSRNRADSARMSREPTRVLVVGTCDGLPELLQALERHDDVDVYGTGERAHDAAAALETGDIEVVLFATPGDGGWADELTAIREHTTAPIVLLSSSRDGTLLEEALEVGVAE